MSKHGWIPNQHGAWAMLIVPLVSGIVLRSRVGVLELWLIPLAVAVFTGYFGFNALSLWLKAAPRRRAGYRLPMQVYAITTTVLAAAVMLLGGWRILSWLPVALPLAALAIWLTARRQDRAVASGFATLALAIGVGLAVRFPTPAEVFAGWPAGLPDAAIFVALFCYFFGTVWHVKALIRERGQRPARLRTLAWHAAMIGLAALGFVTGWTSVWWIVFFALTLARTWWLTRPELVGKVKPLQIGLMEITLSIIALLIVIL
ncbi:MAG: YwiC-like family protein [Brooklawnia sp.]|jgi:hypothetical protein